MKHATVLHYTEQLIRRAVFDYWRRTVGLKFAFALAFVAAAIAALLVSGDRTWFVGAIATIWIVGVIFVVALYVIHRRASMAKLYAMGSPEARFEADDQSFRIQTALG